MSRVPLYRALMLELEARRLALGLPMERFSEWAGLPDRYYPKALLPDTPSGRQASWDLMQTMMDALYPHGFEIVIRAKPGAVIGAEDMKAKLLNLRAHHDPKTRREFLQEIGRIGGEKSGRSRMKKLNAKARSSIARNAAKERWKAARRIEREIAHRGREIEQQIEAAATRPPRNRRASG